MADDPRPGGAGHADAAIRAFLIADIRGYTSFTHEHGDEAAARLTRRFAEISTATVDGRGGSVIEYRGDEALAVFASSRQAILAAIDLQSRFVESTVHDPGLPLPVGIGLDAGEAVLVEDGYRGSALNRAARLCSIAGPGEVLATREIAHLAGATDGVSFAASGEVHLKGFSEAVALIRVTAEGWDPTLDAAFQRALGPAAARAASSLRGQGTNPYKGLRAFEEADAMFFFGRESLTDELLERFGNANFLAVVGPSGSGKSSVVRAGVLPALRRGALPGSERWTIVEVVPGAHPLEELEAALLRVAVNPPPSLLEQLERDEHGLLRAIRRILPTDDAVLVLVLDQLEEVFTLVEDEASRTHFLSSIAAAVEEPRGRLRVLTTLRADFYDRPLMYRGFADLMRTYVEALVPLSPDQLERAIVRPAERVTVGLEPGLLAEIVAEIVDQPGGLPLLQYALTELFDRREGNVLTVRAYHEIGGAAGAVARRADEVYLALDDLEREAARQLFLRLVTLGEGAEDTRRRVDRSELQAMEVDERAMVRALDAFGASRLLSFDRDAKTKRPTVEVAHESLLRVWGRLRAWIDAAREDLRLHRRLSAAAAEWADADRDPSFLPSGSRLGQFATWAKNSGIVLTGPERAYLDAALKRDREREAAEEARRSRERLLERRSVVRMRALVAVLGLAALVASSLTVVASRQRARAEEQARIATARELASASLASLERDPELGILLALRALYVTRSADGTVLREAEEALHQALQASRALMRFDAHPTAIDVDASGKRLITVGNNSAIAGDTPASPDEREGVVWDLSTGRRVLTLVGHEDRIWDARFSPDGSRIATIAEDGTAAIWDANSGERLHTLRGHEPDSWTFLDFSPDGSELVTTDGGLTPGRGMLRIWNVASGELARGWRTRGGICGVAYSPDGRRIGGGLCSAGGGAAFVWDARTGRRVATFDGHPDFVFDVAFSPDGRRVASAGIEGVAKVWDAETGRELITLSGHGGYVISIAFGPDGSSIATASTDGTARIWDASTGAPSLVLSGFGGGVGALDFTPDASRLVTGASASTVVWDVSPAGTHDDVTLVDADPMTSVAYSPDGSSVATTTWGDRGGVARLWDARSGREIRTFSGAEASFDAAFSPDGATLVTVAVDGRPVVWDTGSGKERFAIAARGFVGSVAVSPDGSTIATALGATSIGNAIALWDAASGRLGARFADGLGEMDDIEFDPGGSLLAGGSYEGKAIVWNVATGDEVRSLSGHAGGVVGVAFSPDGGMLATSGFDETARIWDVRTGRQLHVLRGHVGAVFDVAFSPGGHRLATVGDDGTTRIWDVASGREILTLTGHTRGATEVAFSPDGSRVATSSNDGTTRIYILPLDDLIREARSRLTRTWTRDECRRYLLTSTCPVA